MSNSTGTSVSFNNTPQASDDVFLAASTGLTEDDLASHAPLVLNVMANDAGGNAKSLYSIDDGINSAGAHGDLLQQDLVGSANFSLHGATIKITADGKVSYDASTLDASFVADLQHLGAGQFATDSFTYAIRLGNGTLSWATATVQIAGVNDAPAITSAASNVNVTELANTASSATPDGTAGAIAFTDLDPADTHSASFAANGAGYLGTFTLDPITQDSTGGNTGLVNWHFSVADGALDFLADGQQLSQKYTVTVSDGHGGAVQQDVTVTLTGSNDAPAITSPAPNVGVTELADASGSTTPDGSAGAIAFTDLDLIDTHSASFAADGAGYLGSFTLDPISQDSTGGNTGLVNWHFSVADGALDFLAAGQHLTQSYTVTVSDGHGGTVPQDVTVTLNGNNDAPTLQAPVAAAPVLANDSLTLTDTLAFTDLDLTDTHAVTFTPQGTGYVGDFVPTIIADANGNGSISTTFHLTRDQVMANGGVFPDHQDYLVTVDDQHGGTSSQIVSIPLAQILSNVGDGGNQPPVITGGPRAGLCRKTRFCLRMGICPHPTPIKARC
jgi:VCBS repeat-containing protein